MFSGYPEVEQSLTFTLAIQFFQDTEEGPRHCQFPETLPESINSVILQTISASLFSSQPNPLGHNVEEIPKCCSD